MPVFPPCATVAAHLTLDIDDGVRRILGNRPLYAKLLQRFRDDHQGLPDRLREALKQADFTLAQQQLHALKGASGMISASAVCHVSTLLETALRTRAPERAALLDALELALDELHCRIASLLPDDGASTEPVPARAATPALLRQLAHYLRENDGAAIALIEQAPAAFSASLGPIRYRQMVAAAQAFQFEAALTILQRRTPPEPD